MLTPCKQTCSPPCWRHTKTLENKKSDKLAKEGAEKEIPMTRATVAEITDSQSSTLRTRVQQFLYIPIHRAYITGNKWEGIPNYNEWAWCQTCNQIESMQHILLECKSQVHILTWQATEDFWPDNTQEWPDIIMVMIMGIRSVVIQRQDRLHF